MKKEGDSDSCFHLWPVGGRGICGSRTLVVHSWRKLIRLQNPPAVTQNLRKILAWIFVYSAVGTGYEYGSMCLAYSEFEKEQIQSHHMVSMPGENGA